MASTVLLSFLPGLTLTLRLRLVASQALAETVTLTESGSQAGEYSGSTALTDSDLAVGIFSGANKVGDDFLTVAADAGTYRVGVPGPVELASTTGSGARTVTVLVTDGVSSLQNATVRLTEGVTFAYGLTDASGEIVLNVEDATYTVAISKPGYAFAGASLVVNGDESVTYAMSTTAISPSSGSFTTGSLTCLDRDGNALVGAVVRVQIVAAGPDDMGLAYDSTPRTLISGVGGLVVIPNMAKGASYYIWIGRKDIATQYAIPSDAGSTYTLPSIVSRS